MLKLHRAPGAPDPRFIRPPTINQKCSCYASIVVETSTVETSTVETSTVETSTV